LATKELISTKSLTTKAGTQEEGILSHCVAVIRRQNLGGIFILHPVSFT